MVSVFGTSIQIQGGLGFQPSELPLLDGIIEPDGFAASGTGTIANIPGVSVTVVGTLVNGRPTGIIVVGGDGKLPGGQMIRYRFVAD